MRSFKQSLLLFSKGLAMGAADVVPGVSGGTIAFASGIYMELINSIKSLNLEALRTLKTQGLAAAWQYINGNFLLTLVSGILTSLFSLAVGMQYLLAQHPLPLWSFFVGLIAGSFSSLSFHSASFVIFGTPPCINSISRLQTCVPL